MAVSYNVVDQDEAESRLDRWFRRHYPQVTQGQLQKLLRTGQIRVDGHRVKASTRLEGGATVRIPPLPEAPQPAPDRRKAPPRISEREQDELVERILHDDGSVLVIDKPPGLAVQGGTSQARHLDAMLDMFALKGVRPRLVHRLDKDTSGVLILARTLTAARVLGQSFRARHARKDYWAVTARVPDPDCGRIDAPLAKTPGPRGERVEVDEDDGRVARTEYAVVEQAGKRAAFVALWPLTGRTHQIRAHLGLIGTPILGDGKYGGTDAFPAIEGIGRGLHLHARRLRLAHPDGGMLDVSAPLPEHMRRTWAYFEFDQTLDHDPFAEVEAKLKQRKR